MTPFNEVNQKFLTCEGLTDEEIERLLAFYDDLAIKVDLLGDEFKLFRNELDWRVSVLQMFRQSRH